tara:strand:- start:4351 stop:5034 length:684 start_codon:yes stop_codon:yes gene_type:complete
MVKNHLSRLTAPVSWPTNRKGVKFIKRPNPGAHTLREGLSLSLALTGLLKYVRTAKEVKKVLHEGSILVNGKTQRNSGYTVGVMDIISAPELKESFRVVYTTKGKFALVALDEKGAEERAVRIANKTLLKKGVVQLNFSDGSNLKVEKDTYKVGDSLVLSTKDGKVLKHLPLKEGVKIFMTGGSQIGKLVTLQKIEGDKIIIKDGKESFETVLRYAFAVGDLKVNKE